MHYYQFNISDYRKDTNHLSLLEHGIYRMLIDTYYLNESPLCADDAQLMRTHNIRTEDDEIAFKNVINDFFIKKDDGYHHSGCDERMQEVYEKSEKARLSAKKRWEKKRTQCERIEGAPDSQSERNANGMLPNTYNPLPITQEPKQKKKVAVKNESFEVFWKEYPKKQSKAQALKTWEKLNPNQQLFDLIMSRIDKFKTSNEWIKDGGQFVPNASTWLNGKRWDDELTYGGTPNGQDQFKRHTKPTAIQQAKTDRERLRAAIAAHREGEPLLGLDDQAIRPQMDNTGGDL